MRIGPLLEFRFAPTPREERFGQLALAVIVACGLAALYFAHHMRPVWLLVLLSLFSPLYRLKEVSPWVVRAARYVAFVFLGGTIVLAYIFMAYPILSQKNVILFTRLGGYGLAGFTFGFLLGARVWRPAVTLIPCVLGVFTVAAFNGAANLRAPLAIAALAGIAYLGFPSPGPRPAKRVASQVKLRVALLALPILLVAWAITWTLPRAQGQVEQATGRFFATSATNYSSLSLQSRLGDLEALQLSGKIVMRVWSSHPQKLRGRVFTHFDGQTWKASPGTTRELSRLSGATALDPASRDWLAAIAGTAFASPGRDKDNVPGADIVRTKIVQSTFNPGLLVSPAMPTVVRAPTSVVSVDAQESLSAPASAFVEIYGVLNRHHGELVQPGAFPQDLLAESLSLPERVDPRMAELAQRLSGEATTAVDRIHHTVQFVQNACDYSLEVGKFRTEDPVAEFLFEKRRGYCEYFASAAALLLRLQGVPCRYVTGFVVQEWNRKGGHFVVREADAHAWIEAYDPQEGWISADPTPEAEYLAARARFKSGWFEDLKEWSAAKLAEVMVYVRRNDWGALFDWLGQQLKALGEIVWTRSFGFALLLLAVVYIVIRLAHRRRKAQPRSSLRASRAAVGPNSKEADELISFLDKLWARKGIARPPSRAPLEHVASLPAEKVGEDFRQACHRAVDYFYGISFGHAAPRNEELRELRQALERARGN